MSKYFNPKPEKAKYGGYCGSPLKGRNVRVAEMETSWENKGPKESKPGARMTCEQYIKENPEADNKKIIEYVKSKFSSLSEALILSWIKDIKGREQKNLSDGDGER